jgi:uncharacterized protein
MRDADRSLDPRVITLWRLQRIVRTATVGVAVAVGLGFAARSAGGAELGVAVGIGWVLFQLLMAAVWPALEFRNFRFAVREHDLLVQSGVLFRRWSVIPLGRIQHLDTRQGLLERALGLVRLHVYTAAGMSADGSIPGLDRQEAEALRDELARRGGDDGV